MEPLGRPSVSNDCKTGDCKPGGRLGRQTLETKSSTLTTPGTPKGTTTSFYPRTPTGVVSSLFISGGRGAGLGRDRSHPVRTPTQTPRLKWEDPVSEGH